MIRPILFLLLVTVSYAASITGRIVGISDGDTLSVLTAQKES
jgi:hypothetical protein